MINALCLAIIATSPSWPSENRWCEKQTLPIEIARSVDRIQAEDILEDARFLSDSRYQGREAGTSGVKKSADYIAARFKRLSLRPGGGAGSYFQQFKIMPGYRIFARLEFTLGGLSLGDFKRGEHFMPVHLPGGRVDITAECVLAGYGLTLPELRFDEYQEVNPQGKVAIVFSGVPWNVQTGGWIAHLAGPYGWASLPHKARNAAAHGAVCLLVVDDPTGWRERLGIPEQLRLPEMEFPLESPIPIIHITQEFLAKITAMTLTELRMLASDISHERQPQSMPLRGRRLHFTGAVSGAAQIGRNVIGILPGRDSRLHREAIVIGAHYDHLGVEQEDVYFGANDNAAGVGAMLAAAHAFTTLPDPPSRTIIFIAFDAEEIGKLGSKHYVSHPCVPLSQTVLMINFDMIGRNKPNEIYAVGTRSADRLHDIHQQVNRFVGLDLVHPASFRLGRSDHTAFYYQKIPILYLFGGLDADYNTPRDTWNKLIPEKLEKVARLAFLTALAVAEETQAIRFNDGFN